MWEFINAFGAAVMVEVFRLLVPTAFSDIAAIMAKVLSGIHAMFGSALSVFVQQLRYGF